MSKGFFEKLGLVESEPKEPIVPSVLQMEEPIVPVTIETDESTSATIIVDVYIQNDMASREKSIYTIEAYLKTLPPEMTDKAKQGSIAGILSVTAINPADLIHDGSSRINLLTEAKDKIGSEAKDTIESATADINKMKELIAAAQTKISDAEKFAKEATEVIDSEIRTINDLCSFTQGVIDGGNK